MIRMNIFSITEYEPYGGGRPLFGAQLRRDR